MDITLLRTFLEVAKARHFGHAADNMFVTQSAVSARIKLLEQSLGVDLFSRKRNDIHLTPAGERLRRHADIIVRGWERAKADVKLEPQFERVLAVGGAYDLWGIMLDDWVASVRENAPDIALRLESHVGDVLLSRLSTGVLDLIFMFEPPLMPDLVMRQVAKVPLELVSTQPKQSVKEAMSSNYVMVDWGTSFAIQYAELFADTALPALRVNHGTMALNLLNAHGGAAYLASGMVADAIEQGWLFRVKEAPIIERYVNVIYRAETGQGESIRQVLDLFPS